jgi:hypothetical protein
MALDDGHVTVVVVVELVVVRVYRGRCGSEVGTGPDRLRVRARLEAGVTQVVVVRLGGVSDGNWIGKRVVGVVIGGGGY